MNSGLYARAGASEAATAAACANLFDEPMTNVSNVYLPFSRVCEVGGPCFGAGDGCPPAPSPRGGGREGVV